MSDDVPMILVVTGDPAFSAQISEPMLRTGAQELRFAQSHEAIDLARELLPAMVLVHAQPGYLDEALDCMALLQTDDVTRTIPALLYAPPQEALLERAAGEPLAAEPCPTPRSQPALPSALLGQLGAILAERRAPAPSAFSMLEQSLPLGRDDL